MGYFGFYAVTIALSIFGLYISNKLKSKFKKYDRHPLRSGMSGAEIAKNMLAYHGINDVSITMVKGALSDHYNPLNKTVNLSPGVYQGRSVAAAAVAAHECGHAIQHAELYPMLQLRSRVVPVVQLASRMQQFLLIIAFVLLNQIPQVMIFTIIAFMITTLFSFITLPVEFDASKRAIAWLESSNITAGAEHEGAKDALNWAALTYVSAALSALVMLIYLVFSYNRR